MRSLDLLRYQRRCFKRQGVLMPLRVPCAPRSSWKGKTLNWAWKKSRFVYLPHSEATLISHVTLGSIAVFCYRLNKFWFYFSGQRRVSQWTSHVTAAESLKSQPGLLEKNSVLRIVVFVKLILSLTNTPSYNCALVKSCFRSLVKKAQRFGANRPPLPPALKIV